MSFRKMILAFVLTCASVPAAADLFSADAGTEDVTMAEQRRVPPVKFLKKSSQNIHRVKAVPPRLQYDAMIIEVAQKHKLDPNLLRAVIDVESDFRADVVSRAGAQGLMQLMPDTARDLGVENPLNPFENLDGGAKYLARLIRQFRDTELALAAYNAGPGRVRRLGRIPDNPETQAYVRAIMTRWAENGAAQN